jgi:hypothetical protein
MVVKKGDSHDPGMERSEKGIPMTRTGYKNVNLRVETTPELTYQKLALNVNNNKNTPSALTCRTDIQVHGVLIDCIIDTGATRTMLSHSIYEKLKNLLGVLEITERDVVKRIQGSVQAARRNIVAISIKGGVLHSEGVGCQDGGD